jgi:hypothetical protein
VWDAVERVPTSAFLRADAAAIGGSDSPYVGCYGSGTQWAKFPFGEFSPWTGDCQPHSL